MPQLDALPVELVNEIISHLPRSDRKGLSALSCASKWLRTVVEPHLYRRVTFDYDSEWTHEQICKQLPIHLLLRTLVHRPSLISKIECLELRSVERLFSGEALADFTFWEPGNDSNRDSSGIKLALALVNSIDPPSKDLWIQGLYAGSFQSCTALLLSQLVNLKRLYLDAVFCDLDGFIPLIFSHSYPESRKVQFPRLEHVERDVSDWYSGCWHHAPRSEFERFFFLPPIKSLRIVVPDNISNCLSLWSTHGNPATSNLTPLALADFSGSVKDLGQILCATPSLKSLMFYHHITINEEEVYDCSEFRSALQHIQHCLEHLVISIRFCEDDLIWAPRCHGKIDFLKDFKKLSEVELPIITLLGWDLEDRGPLSHVLPPTLRKLGLTDDTLAHADGISWDCDEFNRILRQYMKGGTSIVPELKVLSFRLDEDIDLKVVDDWSKLRRICKKAGVKLGRLDLNDIYSRDSIFEDEDSEEEEVEG